MMKRSAGKPVTAPPNASQWLLPHVSRTNDDVADSSMHGVLPQAKDNP